MLFRNKLLPLLLIFLIFLPVLSFYVPVAAASIPFAPQKGSEQANDLAVPLGTALNIPEMVWDSLTSLFRSRPSQTQSSATSSIVPLSSGLIPSQTTPTPELFGGYTELDANPPMAPQRTVLPNGDRVWKTRLGKYTFEHNNPYVFSYHDRFGEQLVTKATYWINSTDVLDFNKVADFKILEESNTVFRYQYSVTYPKKDTVVGIITVTWTFDSVNAPKQSVQFTKDVSAWTAGNLGGFNVFLDVLPVKKYLKTAEGSATNLVSYGTTETVQLLNNVKKVSIGDTSDPTKWNKILGIFWEDYNVGLPVWGGAEKVFGGKGVLIVFPNNVASIDPTLYEYYNTGDSADGAVYGVYWMGQTFTVGATGHTVTSVKLKLDKDGSPTGNFVFSIRATSAGKPTGSDLTSGSVTCASISTTVGWYDLAVTEYTVAASTMYAIVTRATSGTSSNYIIWRIDANDGAYAGGTDVESGDSGVTWTAYSAHDRMFEIWGNPSSVTITFALSGVSNDATGTIIAIGGTNYVYADFPKAFSWTIGSTKSVAATDPVPAGAGKQYGWTQWTNGDGLSGASGTYTVPASAITVTAVYATQWYLTVTSSYGSPTGQAWYTSGNSASSTVTSPVSGGSGVQYVCTGWTGTGSAPASGSTADTGLFSMTAASSVTWSWKTQYSIAFTSSGISTDTTGTVVTVNTAAKTQSQLPFTAWYDSGSSVVYAFTSPVAATSGKQYVWSSTSGLSQTLQSNTFSAAATGTVTGTYGVQWSITITQSGIGSDTSTTVIVVVNTVNKVAADLPFTAWYNDGATINYTYTQTIQGTTYQYSWVSSSGCGQTAISGTETAIETCSLTGNYGIVGGTVTITTTIVSSVTTTTGTTATATTTSVTTSITTATYTSVTVAVTLTSTTISTSMTTSTDVFAGGQPQFEGASYQIVSGAFEKTIYQNETKIYELPIDYTSTLSEFTITSVTFNAKWITLETELPKRFVIGITSEQPSIKIRVTPTGVTPAQYLVRCTVASTVAGVGLSSNSYVKIIVLPSAGLAPLAEAEPFAGLPQLPPETEYIITGVSLGAIVLGYIRRRRNESL